MWSSMNRRELQLEQSCVSYNNCCARCKDTLWVCCVAAATHHETTLWWLLWLLVTVRICTRLLLEVTLEATCDNIQRDLLDGRLFYQGGLVQQIAKASLATCKQNSGNHNWFTTYESDYLSASACPSSLFKHNCGFPLFGLLVAKLLQSAVSHGNPRVTLSEKVTTQVLCCQTQATPQIDLSRKRFVFLVSTRSGVPWKLVQHRQCAHLCSTSYCWKTSTL